MSFFGDSSLWEGVKGQKREDVSVEAGEEVGDVELPLDRITTNPVRTVDILEPQVRQKLSWTQSNSSDKVLPKARGDHTEAVCKALINGVNLLNEVVVPSLDFCHALESVGIVVVSITERRQGILSSSGSLDVSVEEDVVRDRSRVVLAV